jgi:valyl-tRNA synthetase
MLSPNEKQLIQYFVNIVSVIRDLRIKHSIKQAHVIKVNIINNKKIDVNKINQLLDKHNIKIEKLISKTSTNDNLIITNNLTLEYINDFMSQAQNLDVINKKIIFLQNEVKRSENILSNQNFINKAPIEKVNLEKQKLNDYQKQLDELITIVNSTKN